MNFLPWETIRLSFLFADETGVPVDTGDCSVQVKLPGGTFDLIPPNKVVPVSPGNYYVDYDPPMIGSYSYRGWVSAPSRSETRGAFVVKADGFPPIGA